MSAPFAGFDVAAMREGIGQRARARSPGPDMQAVRELRIGAVPARLYRPVAGRLPLVVYLHGGGWTIGSLESHDRMCRRLADGSGAAVLAIGYRLAPEHPWPASVDDTVAALRWVASAPAELGEAPGAVAVVGDSAGGTLAALACLRCSTRTPTSPAPSPRCAKRRRAGAWTPRWCVSSTPSGCQTRRDGLTPASAPCTPPTFPGCQAR